MSNEQEDRIPDIDAIAEAHEDAKTNFDPEQEKDLIDLQKFKEQEQDDNIY